MSWRVTVFPATLSPVAEKPSNVRESGAKTNDTVCPHFNSCALTSDLRPCGFCYAMNGR